ncbi:hypothetical protein EYF80_028946 [Liparis tanakae]|uniref:Uncharacterized protein n=1 Tax=Liparis tanakae TaxID=230148 RepID=A0A4Z2H502_9TELE|nr:hypothetical protein EYF80_028946 [Liparis tanakae]
MDQTEERIIEYNCSSTDYKDSKMTLNSWREISQNTGLEVYTPTSTPSRATLPPASSPVESRVSRPKRKRDHRDHRNDHLDDLLFKEITHLGEQRLYLQQKLLEQDDEYSRFGRVMVDMLRRVPEDKRPDPSSHWKSLVTVFVQSALSEYGQEERRWTHIEQIMTHEARGMAVGGEGGRETHGLTPERHLSLRCGGV